jgi:putative membrane protein
MSPARTTGRTACCLLLLFLPATASAHDGSHHPVWTYDPWIVAPLALSAIAYFAGVGELWRRAGRGRGIRLRQAALYAAGWVVLAGALLSPLHWLGEHLFTAHMIEHELVMAVAAPLLALARPVGAFVWALPLSVRQAVALASRQQSVRSAWRVATRPAVATIAHGAAIWLWHVPALFDAALTVHWLHRLQHLSFLFTAVLFWWALIRRSDAGAAVGHLVFTMIHTGLLGALLTLSPRLLYVAQTADAPGWGLSPLEDQQLAGLVMWIPVGTVYAGAAVAFVALWLRRSAKLWKDGYAS